MPTHLKSFELHGYKTFASRTEFEFSDTITAIVGPNGSGKSNIADALRWVLGEQSYSLLRGKKTEDMIFSGSEMRPRAGMASATIIFNNSEGWLPIDFTEVAITRRAYRDGQNEYLLNSQRVRLKDVSELLAQSGLAERTYTVIGQGLVDAALSLKAGERRRLFEEAAGIGLHRSRREEALRRLENTHRNLERVQDILAELHPRLRSLERQAKRAQEYEQVMADLRLVLREWYGYHWHQAQRELAEAQSNAKEQEAFLEETREGQAELNQKLAGIRAGIQIHRSSLSEWHREMAQFQSRRASVMKDLAVANERERSLKGQHIDIQGELSLIEEEITFYQGRLQEADDEVSRIQAELDDSRRQASEARETLTFRQTERAQAEKAVQEAREALSSVLGRQAQSKARLVEGEAQLKKQREVLQKTLDEIGVAENKLDATESRLDTISLELEAVTRTHHEASKAMQSHGKKLEDVESARRAVVDERVALQAQLVQFQAQMDVLIQAEDSFSGYAEGARVLLRAIQQSRLPGARGALSNSIEVPEELEIAIAAALGEYIDGVILESSKEIDVALNILGKEGVRGALLPLDILIPPASLKVELEKAPGGRDAILGIASNLVKGPSELNVLVETLLGHVLVVRDRVSARAVLKGLRGRNLTSLRVVTLQGEVFHSWGSILAGSSGKTSLSRPRQRKDIKSRIDELLEQIREKDTRINQGDEELTRLRTEEMYLQQKVGQAVEEEKETRVAHRRVELEVDKDRQALRWLNDQGTFLEAEIIRVSNDVSGFSKELTQLEIKITKARENIAEKRAKFEALTIEEYQVELSHWDTVVAVAEQALVDARNRHQELKESLDRVLRAKGTSQQRLEECANSLASLDVERDTMMREEVEIIEQIDTLQSMIEPAERELAEIEQENSSLLSKDIGARQALSSAEHRHAQAKINLARRQETVESLRRRIEDDFGLVAFEYEDAVSGPTPLPLEGMVEELPIVSELSPEVEVIINRQRAQLRRMGAINPEAQTEYQQVRERFEFLNEQVSDLRKAEADLKDVIAELDLLMEQEFRKTFDAVAQEFRKIFARLFGGGSARLVLTDPEDMTNTGIDIEARLPGRREQGLSLLSGGERSLTAAALVFALLQVSPTPFCVLDEVDAMLDETNVGRFRELLRELSEHTQFIIVTHNRNTVQAADVIYGVTMGRDSASQVISLKLDEVGEEYSG